MPQFSDLIWGYLFVIGLVAVIITVADKKAAKKKGKKRRVPEATLMLVGLFGGALPMYVTMRLIRHKTKHKKFMIGLPLEIALHAVIAFLCFFEK